MTEAIGYRCLACLDHTLSREFDVSHLSKTCPSCGTFGRFVNENVYDQFQAFEESPPESVEWDRLEREEKLMLSERVTRTTRTIDEFELKE